MNPGTDCATATTDSHPVPAIRPLLSSSFYLVSSRNQRLARTFRKRTHQPTAASQLLFRGAEHAPRKERRRDIYGGRNRKMAANLFWVSKERAYIARPGSVENEMKGKREYVRVNFSAMRKKYRSQMRLDHWQSVIFVNRDLPLSQNLY